MAVERPSRHARASRFRTSARWTTRQRARTSPREQVWRGKPSRGSGRSRRLLREGACSDGMSDTVHPVNARVSLPEPLPRGLLPSAAAPTRGHAVWSRAAGQDAAALAVLGPVSRWSSAGAGSRAFPLQPLRGATSCWAIASARPLAGTRWRAAGRAWHWRTRPASLDGTHPFAIAEKSLTLTSESGKTLSFEPQPPPRLEGVEWDVPASQRAASGAEPEVGHCDQLAFENGTVSGSSGCNSFPPLHAARGPLSSSGREHAMLCARKA